jgi:hypothetical protein
VLLQSIPVEPFLVFPGQKRQEEMEILNDYAVRHGEDGGMGIGVYSDDEA